MPRIGAAGVGTQIDDGGIDRQSVLLDAAPDIASHAARHGRGTISGLKLVMHQRLLTAPEAHADEAIGAVGFDGRLLGVYNVEHLKVVVLKGKAGEVLGVGVDEVLGDSIKFGHKPCLGQVRRQDRSTGNQPRNGRSYGIAISMPRRQHSGEDGDMRDSTVSGTTHE